MESDIVIGGAPAGVGFTLGGVADTDARVALTNGWTAEVLSGTQTIVAQGAGASGYEASRDTGLESAQQALDLFCIRGTLSLPIVQVETSHFAWWTESSRTIVRIVGVADFKADVNVSASVVHIHGNPKPPLPVAWHPSFRYFRVAQVSTDLFDAYRNLYLALESILTSMVPVVGSERESLWLRRALRQVD
jgi:hypothetical protein